MPPKSKSSSSSSSSSSSALLKRRKVVDVDASRPNINTVALTDDLNKKLSGKPSARFVSIHRSLVERARFHSGFEQVKQALSRAGCDLATLGNGLEDASCVGNTPAQVLRALDQSGTKCYTISETPFNMKFKSVRGQMARQRSGVAAYPLNRLRRFIEEDLPEARKAIDALSEIDEMFVDYITEALPECYPHTEEAVRTLVTRHATTLRVAHVYSGEESQCCICLHQYDKVYFTGTTCVYHKECRIRHAADKSCTCTATYCLDCVVRELLRHYLKKTKVATCGLCRATYCYADLVVARCEPRVKVTASLTSSATPQKAEDETNTSTGVKRKQSSRPTAQLRPADYRSSSEGVPPPPAVSLPAPPSYAPPSYAPPIYAAQKNDRESIFVDEPIAVEDDEIFSAL